MDTRPVRIAPKESVDLAEISRTAHFDWCLLCCGHAGVTRAFGGTAKNKQGIMSEFEMEVRLIHVQFVRPKMVRGVRTLSLPRTALFIKSSLRNIPLTQIALGALPTCVG